MAENVKDSKSSKTLVIILIIVIVLLLAGGSVAAVLLLNKEDNTSADGDPAETAAVLGYEEGVVLIDPDKAQQQVDEMLKKSGSGIPLMFKNTAFSTDGINFTGEIGNPSRSAYDVYYDLYMDESLEDQLYISALIPPGSKIEKFEINRQLDPGDYEAVLVLTQVEDDHSTLRAQSLVYLTLHVD